MLVYGCSNTLSPVNKKLIQDELKKKDSRDFRRSFQNYLQKVDAFQVATLRAVIDDERWVFLR